MALKSQPLVQRRSAENDGKQRLHEQATAHISHTCSYLVHRPKYVRISYKRTARMAHMCNCQLNARDLSWANHCAYVPYAQFYVAPNPPRFELSDSKLRPAECLTTAGMAHTRSCPQSSFALVLGHSSQSTAAPNCVYGAYAQLVPGLALVNFYLLPELAAVISQLNASRRNRALLALDSSRASSQRRPAPFRAKTQH